MSLVPSLVSLVDKFSDADDTRVFPKSPDHQDVNTSRNSTQTHQEAFSLMINGKKHTLGDEVPSEANLFHRRRPTEPDKHTDKLPFCSKCCKKGEKGEVSSVIVCLFCSLLPSSYLCFTKVRPLSRKVGRHSLLITTGKPVLRYSPLWMAPYRFRASLASH